MVSQQACIACSRIWQCTAAVVAAAGTGHCRAEGDASEHRGAHSPGTGSPVTHSPPSHGHLYLPSSNQLYTGVETGFLKIHESAGQTKLQSRDAPALISIFK